MTEQDAPVITDPRAAAKAAMVYYGYHFVVKDYGPDRMVWKPAGFELITYDSEEQPEPTQERIAQFKEDLRRESA